MTKFVVIDFFDPRKQAVGAGILSVFFMLVGRFVFAAPIFPWLSSAAFMLLFTVFNNGVSIFSHNFATYARLSLWSFAALIAASGLLAYLLSGMSFAEVPTFKTIYAVLIIAHFTLLALCLLIRRSVEFLVHRDKK